MSTNRNGNLSNRRLNSNNFNHLQNPTSKSSPSSIPTNLLKHQSTSNSPTNSPFRQSIQLAKALSNSSSPSSNHFNTPNTSRSSPGIGRTSPSPSASPVGGLGTPSGRSSSASSYYARKLSEGNGGGNGNGSREGTPLREASVGIGNWGGEGDASFDGGELFLQVSFCSFKRHLNFQLLDLNSRGVSLLR